MYSPQNDSAAASEVTLVNPLPNSTLILKTSSVIDNILVHDGWPYFKIATGDATGTRIEISNPHTKEILVKIQRRNLFSDEITFSRHFDGKALKIKDWLYEVKTGNKKVKWVFDTGVGKFAWRLDPQTRLALCPDTDMEHPVAWLELTDRGHPRALILRAGTEDFWDMIVGGWVILQQRFTGEKMTFSSEGWNRLLFDGSLKTAVQKTTA